MREFFLLTGVGTLCCLAVPSAMQAQSDADKIYKTNCVLCHSADGSPTGKAMHAKDLRSDEVQKQSDAAQLAHSVADILQQSVRAPSLLVPQRHHRIHFHRPPRRNVASQQRHTD
jgi:hypothetical protein